MFFMICQKSVSVMENDSQINLWSDIVCQQNLQKALAGRSQSAPTSQRGQRDLAPKTFNPPTPVFWGQGVHM